MTVSIAVVGMACLYPDARSPLELWENALAQRRAFRRVPPERLRLADYSSPDRNAPDSTYAVEAAVIEGYSFDRVRFRVAGSTYRSTDLAHWMALDVASQALADAGYPDGEGLPKEGTGVLVGNTLTGEFSRANTLRLRWPYVRRVVEASLAEQGWTASERQVFVSTLEARYKAPFAPVGAESLAGGLSNTIAGRICNHFDLNGGGYTVDGACASSLLAIANACSALAAGDLDVAIAGGVDLSLDPFELVGFAKTGALTSDEMRVYDERSAGFLPGEGCAFVVLMRYDDAVTEGCQIYADVRGWGISSDGSGGITRPEVDGQLIAVRRAYKRAGFGIDSVGYFEGHGTGTAVGDATELRMLARARAEANPAAPPAVISSIKANIGHTKAAAGVAGFIKAVAALNSQVLPPVTGCETPHAELKAKETRLADVPFRHCSKLTVLATAQPWPKWMPLRAAVSAMGFGGINTHVVLESRASRRSCAQTDESPLMAPNSSARSACADRWRAPLVTTQASATATQDAELFLLAAPHFVALLQQIKRLQKLAPRISRAEMTDLAAALARRIDPQRSSDCEEVRAAIVAATPSELVSALDSLQQWTERGERSQFEAQQGVFLSVSTHEPCVGFLFPGQGTAVYADGGALAQRFAFVQELFAEGYCQTETVSSVAPQDRRLNGSAAQRNGDRHNESSSATAVAQPAIVRSTLAALRVLNCLGLEARCAVGHSLGELSALHWAGAIDEASLLRIAATRGRIMTDLAAPSGTMAYIGADNNSVTQLLNGDPVKIACFNSPRSTVVAGESDAVATIVNRAHESGFSAANLAVSHAFHSPLMAPAATPLYTYLGAERLGLLCKRVISTVTGDDLKPDTDLRELLQRQVTEPVRFTEAVRRMAADVDLLIEVGPGLVLSGLARDSVETPVVGIDAGSGSLRGFLSTIGAAYAWGASLNPERLFADRLTRPFELDWQPRFLANPCELAPEVERSQPLAAHPIAVNGSVAEASSEPLASTVNRNSAQKNPLPFDLYHAHGGQSAPPASGHQKGESVANREEDILALVRKLVAQRVELPQAAIGDQDRLLSDLHMNSITVGQLVAEAARSLQLTPPVAPTEYANVTVATVAQTLAEMQQTGGSAAADARPDPVSGVGAWTRAFTVELAERPRVQRSGRVAIGQWQIFAPADYALLQPVQQAFKGASGDGIVVCLPPNPDKSHVRHLLAGVKALSAMGADARFVLVQHGGGAASFVRTLHLERPQITACVIDVPLDHPNAAAWAVEEALAARGYCEVHYDVAGKRYEPVLRLLPVDSVQYAQPLPGSRADVGTTCKSTGAQRYSIDASDVLLVTGGGKGITAECALSLARETGVRLALMGRSAPESDPELAANLERMRAAKVKFHYVAADVSSLGAVRTAVQEIEHRLGTVTAILHGAARNVPCPLNALDEAAFEATLAPKMDGLNNLLQTVDPAQLRLLVTFGSIIARSGLPGEADYGLANEWLVRLTEHIGKMHPNCRTLAIEWSVWSGAGMGDRLGALDSLLRQGITPIPLDEGVAMLHRLLLSEDRPPSVVVSGRFGTPPTLALEAQELPFWRFLEESRIHYPGVELVVDARLVEESDPYLADHVYAGERLLPAVVGLEAMAQTAMALAGAEEPPIFENVQFERPVVVPTGATVTIRLAALARGPNEVEVVLRSDVTDFQAEHFRATCRFADAGAAGCALDSLDAEHDPLGSAAQLPPLLLEPRRDLYGDLLFHSGRFQRLLRYRHMASTSCVAEVSVDDAAWFGRYMPAEQVLGDAGARDAYIHAIQICVPHATLLPVGVERLIPGVAAGEGVHQVRAREREHAGDIFVYDVDILDMSGAVVERWQGLRLRTVGMSKRCKMKPLALLGPFLEREIGGHLQHSELSVVIEDDGSVERRVRSNLAMQRALGYETAIQRRPDGKPEVTGSRTVSAAHVGNRTLAVAARGAVGCDMEPVSPRGELAWRDLLGIERYKLAGLIAQEAGEDFDTAATRVWTAAETVRKAGAAIFVPITLKFVTENGWVLFKAETSVIATCATAFGDGEGVVVLAAGVLN